MEIDLLGKSVNAPKFLEVLEKEFDWFISYTLLLAEKHFEDPETKRIYIVIVFLGDYLWDIHTLRFEEAVYDKDRTRRHKIAAPPQPVLERALAELKAAYEKTKELPPQIRKRIEEAKAEQAKVEQ
ncbi:MAG: hypothetical protein QMC89_04955 [Candidatus Hodarchaeaceae archaeon]|nr:hypothetical protein [Candidatus Hodarchaeaceae archaeon]